MIQRLATKSVLLIMCALLFSAGFFSGILDVKYTLKLDDLVSRENLDTLSDLSTVVGTAVALYIAAKQLPTLSRQLARPRFFLGFRYLPIESRKKALGYREDLKMSSTYVVTFSELDEFANRDQYGSHSLPIELVNDSEMTVEQVELKIAVPLKLDLDAGSPESKGFVTHTPKVGKLHPGETFIYYLSGTFFPKEETTYEITAIVISKDSRPTVTNKAYIKVVEKQRS